MEDRVYYVFCADGCKFEGMTKEQIFAAIADATGNTPTAIDSAFITKIKELNTNNAMQFWVGTMAQYNAIATAGAVVDNCLYIVTDDTFGDDINAIVTALMEEVNAMNAAVNVVANDTGWLEWSTTISGGILDGQKALQGYYRVIGKEVYCYSPTAICKNGRVQIPFLLDLGDVPVYTPNFYALDAGIESAIKPDTVRKLFYDADTGELYISAKTDETLPENISFTFSFPYGGENPNFSE